MNWKIHCPAPEGARGAGWGDRPFAQALAQALQAEGQAVDLRGFGAWDAAPADVQLTLRGKFRWNKPEGPRRILWIMSHPETVSLSECHDYDLVCAASARHATWLSERLDRPVELLWQATDTGRFTLPARPVLPREGLIFVGNSRHSRRPAVEQVLAAGLPLRIWGAGWRGRVPGALLEAEQLDNRELPALYTRAAVCLNDHWPDMRRWGYVNNRVFDALACGLPVLSDRHPALAQLFGQAVLQFEGQGELARCMERISFDYNALLQAAHRAGREVAARHGFDQRARRLLELAESL